jgi:hypothetical protein
MSMTGNRSCVLTLGQAIADDIPPVSSSGNFEE